MVLSGTQTKCGTVRVPRKVPSRLPVGNLPSHVLCRHIATVMLRPMIRRPDRVAGYGIGGLSGGEEKGDFDTPLPEVIPRRVVSTCLILC